MTILRNHCVLIVKICGSILNGLLRKGMKKWLNFLQPVYLSHGKMIKKWPGPVKQAQAI